MRPLCVFTLALFVSLLLATSASAKSKPQYYLSLGDSLSVGVQPGPASNPGQQKESVNTNEGYTDQLFAKVKRLFPGLRLVKAGCGGATTQSFINGGVNVTGEPGCSPARNPGYASTSRRTSQLAFAESFLRDHRGQVVLVTLDIGNNNVSACAPGGAIDLQCVSDGVALLNQDLPVIIRRLKRAAGRAPIIGATFYDPFLQLWLNGESGQQVAAASQALAKNINEQTIIPAYSAKYVKVARIDEDFGTYADFSQTTPTADLGTVPVAVYNICIFTWMCTPAPAGPNIHANKTGYKLMANSFYEALRADT